MADGAFHLVQYVPPDALPALDRITGFMQVFQPFTEDRAQEQAARCIECDNPGCNTACPVHQPIPLFNAAVARGDWREAYELAVKDSPIFGLYGQYICPPTLCHTHCTVNSVNTFGTLKRDIIPGQIKDTIAIGGVENAIWRKAIEQGWLKYPKSEESSGYSVEIMGAGPAALHLGVKLNQRGHHVTINDLWDEIGGLLLKGIPDFKMDKSDLPIIRRAMEDAGIRFNMNTRVTDLNELRNRSDAVVIATGTYTARDITHPDTGQRIEGHDHIHDAMYFLKPHNDMVRHKHELPSDMQVKGKDVIVIGAGDTSMDCVRTAMRMGASSVTTLVRSAPNGSLRERTYAAAESEIVRERGSQGMEYHQCVPLAIKQQDGRFNMVVRKDGEALSLPADVILNAAGFALESPGAKFGMPELALRPQARTQTTLPNVWVAGDARVGADLAVKAGADGNYASTMINSYLAKLAA